MNTDTPIYLDYNATNPVRPEVIDAMASALSLPGNPSSVHAAGRDAHRVLEDARDQIAAAINAVRTEIVFTSGGTEADALALSGAGARYLVVSAIEHDAVLAGAELGNDTEATKFQGLNVTMANMNKVVGMYAAASKPTQ